MPPEPHLNWLAMLVSVVASFAIGGVWYGPLFGKVWARSMGFPDGQQPSGAEIAKGSVINIIGLFLMSFGMAHNIGIHHPSLWGTGADGAPYMFGLMSGFFTWLTFIVPILLNGVAFERKSWKVFGIGAGYQLISLQVMGMIIAYWR